MSDEVLAKRLEVRQWQSAADCDAGGQIETLHSLGIISSVSNFAKKINVYSTRATLAQNKFNLFQEVNWPGCEEGMLTGTGERGVLEDRCGGAGRVLPHDGFGRPDPEVHRQHDRCGADLVLSD